MWDDASEEDCSCQSKHVKVKTTSPALCQIKKKCSIVSLTADQNNWIWQFKLLFTLTWRAYKVKVHQNVDPQFLQLQHHGVQTGPQNFWVQVVLYQLKSNSKWISRVVRGAYYLPTRCSCVSSNRARESGLDMKGYLACLKHYLLRTAWRERISPLTWEPGSPQVHLSPGDL